MSEKATMTPRAIAELHVAPVSFTGASIDPHELRMMEIERERNVTGVETAIRFALAAKDAEIDRLRAGFAQLVRDCETHGRLTGYHGDILDRAKAVLNPPGGEA